MANSSYFHAIRYTKYYHKMQGQELLVDMFNDEAVRPLLKVGWDAISVGVHVEWSATYRM